MNDQNVQTGQLQENEAVKQFLQLLGVPEHDAEKDACETEHVISESTFKAIKNFVAKNK